MSTSNDVSRRSSRKRVSSVRLYESQSQPSPELARTQNACNSKAAKTQSARLQASWHISLGMTTDEALTACIELDLSLKKSYKSAGGSWHHVLQRRSTGNTQRAGCGQKKQLDISSHLNILGSSTPLPPQSRDPSPYQVRLG